MKRNLQENLNRIHNIMGLNGISDTQEATGLNEQFGGAAEKLFARITGKNLLTQLLPDVIHDLEYVGIRGVRTLEDVKNAVSGRAMTAVMYEALMKIPNNTLKKNIVIAIAESLPHTVYTRYQAGQWKAVGYFLEERQFSKEFIAEFERVAIASKKTATTPRPKVPTSTAAEAAIKISQANARMIDETAKKFPKYRNQILHLKNDAQLMAKAPAQAQSEALGYINQIIAKTPDVKQKNWWGLVAKCLKAPKAIYSSVGVVGIFTAITAYHLISEYENNKNFGKNLGHAAGMTLLDAKNVLVGVLTAFGIGGTSTPPSTTGNTQPTPAVQTGNVNIEQLVKLYPKCLTSQNISPNGTNKFIATLTKGGETMDVDLTWDNDKKLLIIDDLNTPFSCNL
jgi:hypothetical protein